MHMANELLSVPVAAGTCAVAAASLGLVCQRAKKIVTPDQFALMGIMGAFVFAAQMINFQLPFLPGTSGHLTGAVLLAIMLGPYAAAIVISSVVIVQCLVFQDGGLLALGCNIINIAIVPSFLGFGVYRLFTNFTQNRKMFYAAGITACIVATTAGAMLIPVQAAISGVLMVPLATFLITIVGVHLIIGTIEGLITAAVLLYLKQVRPETITSFATAPAKFSKRTLYLSLIIATVIIAAGITLFASQLPDGLEWSYAERPEKPNFKPIVSNRNTIIAAVSNLHSRYSPLPNYTIRTDSAAAGWTSFAAVLGSGLTMAAIWLAGRIVRKRNDTQNAPHTN